MFTVFCDLKQKRWSNTKTLKFKVNHLRFTVVENWNYLSNHVLSSTRYWHYYLPASSKQISKTFLHLKPAFFRGVIPMSNTYISCTCKMLHWNPDKYTPPLKSSIILNAKNNGAEGLYEMTLSIPLTSSFPIPPGVPNIPAWSSLNFHHLKHHFYF